ncbi:SpaH/EbpB family LPXTG-anchored major pilin [Corynebacterium renale]|uniref:LPXTG-motif cell wall-anchored protein n=1 Tax=Corynebacterium renale TaxID=1724 RepID=A0A2A9DLM6_9CORY|nr:SpaH/EbpB family LPXTG-anchored major pilin [Corynebacterium renale]PFG27494.1 LPXTG-motif cell wall-anchored protein [Corynebacterium renale]
MDPDAKVTLTIDKRLNPTAIGGPGSGVADPAVTGNPLQGATFTGTLLNVDNVDPAKLGTLTAANYKELGATLTQTTVTGTTGADGKLVFEEGSSSIDQGIWLFTETIEGEVTDTVTQKTYAAADVAPSTPFIVSLPYTNSEGNGWNYNVTVQPKNTTSGITKEVVDADQNVSDDIKYLVKGTVPVIPQGETLKAFRITDTLDVENLENIRAEVALSDGTAIADGADYDLTINQATGEVEVKFTQDGLKKLSGLAPATTVDLTITAKVKPVAGTDGIAVNEARQHIHYPGQDQETTTTSEKVKTYWGLVNIVKTEEGKETPLQGAEFELYRCTGAETEVSQLTDKITVGSTDKWTTGEDGKVVIDGLHVTDVENNSSTIDKTYCLVETKAPKGFVATKDIISFKLVSSDEKLNTSEPVQYTAKVENKRSEMPQLPLTGGMGVGILAALAALVAGLAAWVARRNNAKA